MFLKICDIYFSVRLRASSFGLEGAFNFSKFINQHQSRLSCRLYRNNIMSILVC